MITEVDIHLPLRKAAKEDARRKAVAQELQLSPKRVQGLRLLTESRDARRRPICKQLRLLKEFAIFSCCFRPFTLVTMVDVGLRWTINWSAFGISAIAFATSDSHATITSRGQLAS